MKGWIALDIDGTITVDKYTVPTPCNYVFYTSSKSSGWNIAIATGRSFVFASMALSDFDFPYALIVQNGSAVLQMPDKKILYKKYLPASYYPCSGKKLFEGIDGSFLVYSGCEKGDFCYYKPKDLSLKQQAYVQQLQLREKEPPRPLSSFEELADTPLIKCFGSEKQMLALAETLRQTGLFQVAFIRDPFDEEGGRLLRCPHLLASSHRSSSIQGDCLARDDQTTRQRRGGYCPREMMRMTRACFLKGRCENCHASASS